MALIFSAPAGPRNVPTGEAPGGPSRRTRNPGNEVLLRSPRRGERTSPAWSKSWPSSAPAGAGETGTLSMGCAADRLRRPALHPCLQAFAPPGQQATGRALRSQTSRSTNSYAAGSNPPTQPVNAPLQARRKLAWHYMQPVPLPTPIPSPAGPRGRIHTLLHMSMLSRSRNSFVRLSSPRPCPGPW